MRLATLVAASERVAATRARSAKVALLAETLVEGRPWVPVLVPWLAGDLRQGKIGVGPAAVAGLLPVAPAASASLTIEDVDAAFEAVRGTSGPGSAARRTALLTDLWSRATSAEQAFLGALLTAALRQGALAGLLGEAVARAAGVELAAVRRATMLAGEPVAPCLAAFADGEAGLRAFDLELFRPVQPMLAEPVDTVDAALAALGAARFEQKIDGARIQVHRRGGEVRVWTRALLEVTDAVPEVVELVSSLPSQDLVLDGEVWAVAPDGRPLPFQTTLRRVGRRTDIPGARAEVPLHATFFDVLRVDGRVCVDDPLRARLAQLERLLAAEHRVRAVETADPAVAAAFVDAVLAEGHEGVMAKDPASPYEAGHRGARWLKLKPAFTLDLVVLAAEWGSGRRHGALSNLHLGARDGRGAFVMLGKTFKGLTDETLAWQTRALLEREVRRDGPVVHVRPELVVEVTFQDVQRSPRYPGGVALRLARVERYRPDKRPEDADTLDTVLDLFRGVTRKARR